MSNFEKKLNSRKMLPYRTWGQLVILIIIGFFAVKFPGPITYIVGAAIVAGIVAVEVKKYKERKK